MEKIWLTSDLHLGHDRNFIWGPRGFNSVEEHDETIIKNWNELVSPDDEVWCLGDLMLGDNYTGCQKLNQLAGKIYILAGNHDTSTRVQMYANLRPTILTMGLAYILKYQGYRFYLSHYPTIVGNYDADKPLKQRVIGLCGHVHTQDPFYDADKGLIYHVELDAHGNKPILLDNIIEDIKNYIGENK